MQHDDFEPTPLTAPDHRAPFKFQWRSWSAGLPTSAFVKVCVRRPPGVRRATLMGPASANLHKCGLRSTSTLGRDRTFGARDRRQHDDLADSLLS